MFSNETVEQFHHCQAYEVSGYFDSLKACNYKQGVVYEHTNGFAIAFRSYASIVAIALPGSKVLYELPRHNYSPTTSRQYNRWVKERGLINGNGWSIVDADMFSIDHIGFREW